MKTISNVAVQAMALALLAGCNRHSDTRPILTKEAFFAAAKTCGARAPEFTLPLDGKLPSFSFLDPGPSNTGHATPASQCLADALKGYRFEAMQIRFQPERRPSQ